ncbi:hypothetical protein ACFWFQ_33060, partial [Nocardia salmonicida]|uniref:hypothetical protein n=1 Tax=Nocardia salmonicida TaxID=53431 RepID=UPI00365AB84B
ADGHIANDMLDKILDLYDTYLPYRSGTQYKRDLGEEIGVDVARYHLEKELGAEVIYTGHGNESFDIVAVKNGKLIIVEAKGGTGRREKSWAQDDSGKWHHVDQGSLLYLRYILAIDTKFHKKLKEYDDKNGTRLLAGLKKAEGHENRVESTKLEYLLVEAPYADKAGTVIGDPKVSVLIREQEISMLEPSAGTLGEGKPSKRRPSTATVIAGLVMSGLGAGAAAAAAAKHDSPTPNAEIVLVAAVTDANEQSSGEGSAPPPESARSSGSDQFGDGILSILKSTVAEFSRMTTSFTNYVQNGLNELVVMVGGAISAVSGFVSDAIDSAGVQAVIDRVSDDWAFAQELLNIAMLFSPVGTVAAAISAAVPIIQLIIEHWDQIRAAFDWVLKNVLTPVAEFFMTAFKAYITPYRLAFDAVMAGFNGMGGVVGTAVGTVRSTVAGIVNAIGQIFQRLEINIGFPVNKSFGLKSIGDAMVAWASEQMADGGLVGGQRGSAPRRASGIEVMAVIDRSVLRAAQAEERKIGYAYRPPFLHDGALPRMDSGPGPRTFDVRVADVDAAFAQIRMLQAVQDARFSPVGV